MSVPTKDRILVIVQILLLVAVSFANYAPLNFTVSPVVEFIGGLLCGTGAVLGLTAVAGLGRSLSPYPTPTKENELQTTGAFRYARHPIYTAILLFFLGFSLYFGSGLRLILLAVLAAFLYYKSGYEEELLVRRYGAAYEGYRGRTGRFTPWF